MSRSIKPTPPSLKQLDRFLKTAAQVEKYEPLVAYCCRQHAIEEGITMRGSGKGADPETKAFLHSLMDQLEQDKTKVDALGISSKHDYMKNFALKVFKIADDEDRAGKSNKNTARNFLHASIFFDVLKQFEELSPELVEMQRYAKWKATDIAQALREGRQPTAGSQPGTGDEFPAATPHEAVSPQFASETHTSTGSIDDSGSGLPNLDALLPLPPRFVPSSSSTSTASGPSFVPDVPDIPLAPAFANTPLPTAPSTRGNPPNASAGITPSSSYSTPINVNPAQPPSFTQHPTQQQQARPPIQPNAQFPPPQPQQQQQQQQQQVGVQATPSPYISPVNIAPQPYPASHSQAAPAPSDSIYTPNEYQMLDAQKFTKYALSALQFDDVSTAVKNLRQALHILTGEQQ